MKILYFRSFEERTFTTLCTKQNMTASIQVPLSHKVKKLVIE